MKTNELKKWELFELKGHKMENGVSPILHFSSLTTPAKNCPLKFLISLDTISVTIHKYFVEFSSFFFFFQEIKYIHMHD